MNIFDPSTLLTYYWQNTSTNVFDNLPALAPPKLEELRDELARFLSTDVETVDDVLAWWYERRSTFPHLSRMALDYLTIPGIFPPLVLERFLIFYHSNFC